MPRTARIEAEPQPPTAPPQVEQATLLVAADTLRLTFNTAVTVTTFQAVCHFLLAALIAGTTRRFDSHPGDPYNQTSPATVELQVFPSGTVTGPNRAIMVKVPNIPANSDIQRAPTGPELAGFNVPLVVI